MLKSLIHDHIWAKGGSNLQIINEQIVDFVNLQCSESVDLKM